MSTSNAAIAEPSNEVLDQIDSLIVGEDPEPPESEQEETQEVEDSIPEKDESEDSDREVETDEAEGEAETTQEIDYDQVIPMPDGRESMTIGQMKDAVNSLEREKEQLDEQRMQMIQRENEVSQYLAQMKVEIPPEFRNQIQQQQASYLQQQHEQMVKMIPEMKDPSTFKAMRESMVKTAAKSNFTEQEIAMVSDARVIHLLNRLAKYEALEQKARENAKVIKGQGKVVKGQQRRIKTKSADIDRKVSKAVKSNNQDTKLDAIDALINS